jgi:exopolysaccharide biosynthesis polyprenyl glycosylphosphotransferase
MLLRHNPRFQALLIAADALCILVALVLASALRQAIDLGIPPGQPDAFDTPPALFIAAPALWIIAMQQARAYSWHNRAPWASVVRSLAAGHIVAGLLFLGALYLIYRDYSRLQAAYFLVISFCLLLVGRWLLRRTTRQMPETFGVERRVLVIGLDDAARRVGERVQASAGEMALVGYVSPDAGDLAAQPAIGSVDDLAAIVERQAVTDVIIASRWFDERTSQRVTEIMTQLERCPVSIRVAPDYSELAYFQARPESFNGLTLIALRDDVLTPGQRWIKRTGDIFGSLFVLTVTAPVMLAAAIAICRDSPGPIIYRQERIGQHGRRFTIYKFRTMRVQEDAVPALEKARSDPRVTRVGAFLRRTSIDELPQFYNVLRGDMSIVGPRPEVAELAAHYVWWQRKRFEVPQGITGWWQVNGRSDRPLQEHIEDDLYYVQHYSLWLDMQILLRTVGAVISGRGAY